MPTYTFDLNRTNEINRVYDEFLLDQTPLQIFFGGASSGKSYFLAQRLVWDLIQGGRNYLVLRNVGTSIRDSVFKEVKKCITKWELNKYFKINETDFKITNTLNKYQAMFKGLDDVQKIKSITADVGNVTDLWYEEATECKRDDCMELSRRLRGKDGSNITKRQTFSFNPILKTNWIYKEFFQGRFSNDDKVYKDSDMLILKTIYKDNNYLTEQDIKNLENVKDKGERLYQVYTLGNWGILGALIFTNWEKQDLTEIRDQFDNYKNGLDFGFTNDPSAGVRVAMRGDTIYITDAFYGYGMRNNVIAENIRKIMPLTMKENGSQEYVLAESAEPKSIDELQHEHNINVRSVIKKPGDVNYGIQWIQQRKVVIHNELQDVINEFEMYEWKEDKKTGNILNIPIETNNHAIDAIRYALSEQIHEMKTEPIGDLRKYGIWM